MVRIGVYVCHCGLNIAGVVDVKSVAKYAATLPNVEVARDNKYLCSDTGQKTIKDDIKKHRLDRVVIASCSPRMHEETFRRTVNEAKLNPYLMEMVNIREQDSWCHSEEPERATEKAKELVEIAVARAAHLEPLETGKIQAKKSVLVLGGGIAGIQAALDMADVGLKVHLVEKAPSIGGRMAQLDKTFPTLDCSACILTPKMVDVAKHPNIELITNAEVTDLKGYVGNYEVSVVKKPRYVDEDKCVGCELCTQACPVKVPDKFNENLSQTKAISVYSPQAVPKVATVDPEYCLRLKYKKDVCGKCLQACEARAINFEQKPETINLEVGAIVMAVGSSVFDASLTPELGYGHYKNVITNLEFERLCNAAGPTEGKILSPTTGKPPKSIAFIQCVGSRDKRFCEYCCRVGCMITLKQAILVKEKMGDDVDTYVCYNDMRAFGKAYEEFYNRARRMDIKFVKGLPSEVKAHSDGSLHFEVYEPDISKLIEVHADLVVLASGLVPSQDYALLQSILR
ncbi:MAG: CoB--CoM heterodisulfide reductase iron-sulfur subunit A family protein, partial [Candidatus Bathyarchaeota archaeon]|nr:CoB--CoM heterodisulfide reductase iron-sulfur subunit A family protein [Candidatus Bathyarchaeota archaeon]